MATSNRILIQHPLPFDDTIIIPLTKGQFAVISTVDADLAELNWCASFYKSYANGGKFLTLRKIVNFNGRKMNQYLHRVILSRMLGRPLLHSEKVDHIFGFTLDNRRSELRLATCSQNNMNRSLQSNSTSGFKGVSWHEASGKWMARVKANGKTKYLGLFDTPEAAFAEYWKEAQIDHGSFARAE